MKLEEFINLVSQLNSLPFPERDPEKMISEVLRRVKHYTANANEFRVPLTLRYRKRTRKLYVVVTIDKERRLLLLDWRYIKPQNHELMKERERERQQRIEKKLIEKSIRMYFKLKQ